MSDGSERRVTLPRNTHAARPRTQTNRDWRRRGPCRRVPWQKRKRCWQPNSSAMMISRCLIFENCCQEGEGLDCPVKAARDETHKRNFGHTLHTTPHDIHRQAPRRSCILIDFLAHNSFTTKHLHAHTHTHTFSANHSAQHSTRPMCAIMHASVPTDLPSRR